MRRVLFGLWLVSTLGVLFALSLTVFPGAKLALISCGLFWLLGVVPLSFLLWFRSARRREEADVDAALEAWHRRGPGAGRELAKAVQEALDEEDEVSLKRLLIVLEAETDFAPFIVAANRWMTDESGRSSRESHLEAAKELARPILPILSAR